LSAPLPAEQPMWSFGAGSGGTVQAPLQFMSRAPTYPTAGGGGNMSDTNLGMFAAVNPYSRGASEDQQPEAEQQRGGDGGEDEKDGDDSGEENHGNATNNSSQ
jgi:hypothetical protein